VITPDQPSSVFMQEVTGGFEDEGPDLSEYAAVLLDQEGCAVVLSYCASGESYIRWTYFMIRAWFMIRARLQQ